MNPQQAMDEWVLRPVQAHEVDAVMAIEVRAYPFPWSRGNLVDSLKAGHRVMGLWGPDGSLVGYCVSMGGVEERHVLNLTVDPACQGRGHAQQLLDDVVAHARSAGETRLWLEVRQSNQRAQALYRRRGFDVVGLRRGYYPNGHGQREDAVVMALNLEATHASAASLDDLTRAGNPVADRPMAARPSVASPARS